MPTFTTELRQRRVLPLLGAYLGGMWLLTELAGFAVERFGLAGRWADGLFLAMWLLLPSAVLVIWRAGPPGDAVWRRRDGVVFAVNAVVAAVALAVVLARGPSTAELEAQPATPVVTPAAERPARVAVFTRAETPKGRQDAMALLALTMADVEHDTRVKTATLLSSGAIVARLRRGSQADPLLAPLGDLRLAAQDADSDGYVVARLVAGEDGQRLEAEFHALDPDRSLPPLSVPAGDAWIAADALAAEIRTRFAPASLASEANDPPVRAVTTDSAEALAAYAAGLEALSLDNDPARGALLLRQAWELDPDFTLAGFGAASALSQLGKTREVFDIRNQILPRMSRLPERQRFSLQLMMDSDPARQRVVHEAWLRKFPKDREPRLALAWLDFNQDPGNASALATISELALSEGNASGYAHLANVHRRLGQNAQAVGLLRDGLAKFPGEGTLIAPLADALTKLGQADEATKLLEDWAQLRPDLVTPWVQLSLLHFNQNRMADANAALERARAQASNPGARMTVLQYRALLLSMQGRLREALALLPELKALQQDQLNSMSMLYRIHHDYAAPYSQVHGRDATLAWIREALPADADPVFSAYLLSQASMLIASELQEVEAMTEALAQFRAALAMFDPQAVSSQLLQADRHEADLLRLSGQPGEALARFVALEPEMRLAQARGQMREPDGAGFYVPAIRAAVAAGDLAQARRWLEAVEVAEGGDPNTQMARAELLRAAGDTEGARASLDKALATWAGADPEFLALQRARALAGRIPGRD